MKPKTMRQQKFEDFYLPFGGKLKSSRLKKSNFGKTR
jgi:hypothetical protein